MRLRVLVSAIALTTACTEYGIDAHTDVPDEPDDTGAPDVEPDPDSEDPEDSSPPEDTTPDIPPDDPVPPARLPVYAHSSDTLYSVEPSTGVSQRIGTFVGVGRNFDGMVDLAIDTAGRLYGASWSGLWRVDPTNAEATWVCATDSPLRGLAFASDGRLFGADIGVFRVDVATCALTPLGGTSTNYSNSGDLVGLPDGNLYWTVNGDWNDDLVRLNPNTGAATLVGALGASSLWGVGYHDGSLFGFDSSGGVHRINPNTASTVLLTTASASWYGATTNPVVWP